MRFRLFILFIVAAAARASAQSLTVSAAISLKEAISEIAKDFDHQTASTITLNFGASGQLAAQISQGAPADVFLSAGLREMRQLEKQDLIDPVGHVTLCRNEIVLVVSADAPFIPSSFADLADHRIEHIAMGQPANVPAGEYGMEVLKHENIADAVAAKLVFGQNVRQVLTYVTRKEVEAGIVYATDAIQAGSSVRLAVRADPSMHEPIIYPAAVIRGSAHLELARRFLAFLGSGPARSMLSRDGFLVDLPTTRPTP